MSSYNEEESSYDEESSESEKKNTHPIRVPTWEGMSYENFIKGNSKFISYIMRFKIALKLLLFSAIQNLFLIS